MTNFDVYLADAKTVAIAGHVRPDGDCAGSCLATYNYIKNYFPHVKVDLYLEPIPNIFKFMKRSEEILSEWPDDRKYDLFIAQDCGDAKRLGNAAKYFESAEHTICVDHHVSNHGFADENVILPDASSACEVLCSLMDPEKINKQAACALYMGIAHDTGVFQYSCTSPDTMRVAAMLMEKGVPHTYILEETYYKKTYRQNQVMGKALLESMRLMDGKIIISVMRKREMDFFGVTTTDLDGIVSQLKLTEGVEVAIFLYEVGNMEFKVSLRSKEQVDVSKVASYFGGGGHVRAAGVTMKGTFHDIINNLTLHIERQMLHQEE